MRLSVFVTGTDTGVGKTSACVALLQTLRTQGGRAVGMKPVASGCELIDGEWRNADALALQAASVQAPPYALANLYALPAPTAPEIAPAAIDLEVELAPLCTAYAELVALPTASWWRACRA